MHVSTHIAYAYIYSELIIKYVYQLISSCPKDTWHYLCPVLQQKNVLPNIWIHRNIQPYDFILFPIDSKFHTCCVIPSWTHNSVLDLLFRRGKLNSLIGHFLYPKHQLIMKIIKDKCLIIFSLFVLMFSLFLIISVFWLSNIQSVQSCLYMKCDFLISCYLYWFSSPIVNECRI